jgi:hypothetical protein
LNFDALRVEEEKAERLWHSQQRECLGWQSNIPQVLDHLSLCLAPNQQQKQENIFF